MAQTTRPRVREAPFGHTLTLVPGAKDGLAGFSAAVWEGGEVTGRLKELVFLRASIVNRCDACTRGHMASARRRGVAEEELAAVGEPTQWAGVFSEADIVALDFATRLCHEAHDLGADLIARLNVHYTERQIAELILVGGLANMSNRAGLAAKQLLADR